MRKDEGSPGKGSKPQREKIGQYHIAHGSLYKYRVLDLCCGLKGVSKVFENLGWDVVTVDYDPRFDPDICADINNLHIEGNFDLIWASPECTEYTKYALPASWKCQGGNKHLPDVRLFLNCYRIIRYLKPRFWVMENVSGAIPFFDPILGAHKRVGSRILWGDFPPFDTDAVFGKWKLSPGKDRAAIRSKIPENISRALEKSIRWWYP